MLAPCGLCGLSDVTQQPHHTPHAEILLIGYGPRFVVRTAELRAVRIIEKIVRLRPELLCPLRTSSSSCQDHRHLELLVRRTTTTTYSTYFTDLPESSTSGAAAASCCEVHQRLFTELPKSSPSRTAAANYTHTKNSTIYTAAACCGTLAAGP